MIDQQIESIKNALREMLQIVTQRGEPLSNELKAKIAQVMEHAANRITALREDQKSGPVAQLPIGSDLLWILSGGKPEAFVEYLRTVPDPALNALAGNTAQLKSVIQQLAQRMPQGLPESKDGIPHAALNSSNIYGFKYDPRNGKLLVRFQSGSVYGYDSVPPEIFKLFQKGAVPAKTEGRNRTGTWWAGKIPSLGAAFYELIKKGEYPYQKLK